MQASATVGAGVKDAAAASSGLQSSTNSLARHPTPALPSSESTTTRLIPLKPRTSLGAPIPHALTPSPKTPLARSSGLGDPAGPDPFASELEFALELASTMQPAEGKRYLSLLRLQQQARITGNEAMAAMYMQRIEKILDSVFSSGSGSSAGSSSGGSVGMGASSVLSDAPGAPRLPKEVSSTIERDFAAAPEAVAAQYKSSINSTTAISRVKRVLEAVVESLPAVYPPHGTQLYALLVHASIVSDEKVVLLSAEGLV